MAVLKISVCRLAFVITLALKKPTRNPRRPLKKKSNSGAKKKRRLALRAGAGVTRAQHVGRTFLK